MGQAAGSGLNRVDMAVHKDIASRSLLILTIGWIIFMLLSLKFGFLDRFFYGAVHADVQGMDYFAAPKGFLNLLEHRSIFDTWGGTPYGPHATWYLAHPAFCVFVASWFSFFEPWTSYWLFTAFSIGLLLLSGHLIAQQAGTRVGKSLSYFLVIGSFPTYWLLYSGNIHGVLVLSLTLLLVGLYELTYKRNQERPAQLKILAGLLISLFSKPIVLLMLPIFLLNKETRRTTVIGMIIYAFVSILFIVVPILNPESIGLRGIVETGLNPQFIREHLNIYRNHFVLNATMKDNAMHWFNLIAQSEFYWNHIDIFSLSSFVNGIAGKRLPGFVYKIPIYVSLLLSFGLLAFEKGRARLEISFLLVIVVSLTFYLSYNSVWEYQFSSILPALALMPVLYRKNVFYKKAIPAVMIIGALFYLPTGYFLVSRREIDTFTLSAIRFNRTVPALLLFLIFVGIVIVSVSRNVFGQGTGSEPR